MPIATRVRPSTVAATSAAMPHGRERSSSATAIANAAVVWSLGKPASAAWRAKRWTAPGCETNGRGRATTRETARAIARARPGPNDGAADGHLAGAARQQEGRDEQPQEQHLRRVGVGDERILEGVVPEEQEVE